MERILITADDFTGALDTGIQFAKKGIPVKVITDWKYDLSLVETEIPVIVVDTESRPLTALEAYDRVYEVTCRGKKAGITCFYKKTDSALRGNIGSELAAMMDACGKNALMMAPAFPRIDRLTKDGVHYIKGVPVAESVFGKDPFEPVTCSKVEEILRSQTDCKVINVSEESRKEAVWCAHEKTIFVFDVSSEESLESLAEILKEEDRFRLAGGCAGLAAYYDKWVDFPAEKKKDLPKKNRLLCLCGSVNPITVSQVEYAAACGFGRENIASYKRLEPAYYDSENGQKELDALYEKVQASDAYIIETWDVPGEETTAEYAKKHDLTLSDVRERITGTLGRIGWELTKRGYDGAISCTGGDTLMGFMKQSGCSELVPLAEIGQGAVLSETEAEGKKLTVISKSGGFGAEDILIEMIESLKNG